MTFEEHAQLPDNTHDGTDLWRYVDLYRYLDLLQTRELHFTRADAMEDPWEGSYGPVNVADRPILYGDNWDEMSKWTEVAWRFGRTHGYMNCWYAGEHESYAMWKLYDVSGKGVAIKTTTGRLKAALEGGLAIHGAHVRYVDYTKTFIPEGNLFFPLVHKRMSFQHESEYRLLTMWSPEVLAVDENNTATDTAPDDPPAFLRETVDLTGLIEAVYVSPDAPEWVAEVVSRTTERYLPEIDVRHSDLRADPIY